MSRCPGRRGRAGAVADLLGSPPVASRVERACARDHGRAQTLAGYRRESPTWPRPGDRKPAFVFDIPIAGPLLSTGMSEIAQAIADRQSEIDRLQAEIKALTDVEQILGASAPKARSTSRRSSSPQPTKAAAAADSKSAAKPARKRREMSAAEKKAVSERMTAYWAERRKKAAKK